MGHPVIFFQGSGSSRLDHPVPEGLLEDLDIYFISVDRPGLGLSDFKTQRRLLDWPRDVRQLADHLEINRFYVIGHSAGGPHVLACAYQLPDQVIAGSVVSCLAPMSRTGAYRGMPLSNQLLARSARWCPWGTKMIRRMMRSMVMGDPEKAARLLMSSIPECDKEVLYQSGNIEIMVSSLREGFRPGFDGVAFDDILLNQDWGFDLAEIKPRIDIWHGELDVNVPLHAGQYLHAHIPNSRATFLPGEGHFFLLKSWEQVLSVLVE
jgi:pimeloyl-ACP methyl ester carboxylesterase